jgi:hypothetical protein
VGLARDLAGLVARNRGAPTTASRHRTRPPPIILRMLSRTSQAPSGFIEPCLPSSAERPPSGPEWVHEIKHDGYRLMARRDLWRLDWRSRPEVIARRESSYMRDMARKRAFRIGRSRTGLGLFATAPIKKGAFIVEYTGRKLTDEQADKLEARGNRYLYEINSRWTIDGTSRKNLGRYANHSCRPNAATDTIGHKVIIRAVKNIRTGAEITYNYGRNYLTSIITRRGCECDKCRKARADARAKARAKDQ